MNSTTSNLNNVKHSRFLTRATIVALGSSISLTIGIFLLIGPVFQRIGTETANSYIFALLLFIPFVLAYAERTAVAKHGSSLFKLAQSYNRVWLTYWSGWLLIGGLIALGALLASGIGYYGHLLLQHFFGITVDVRLMAVLLTALTAVNQLFGTHSAWRRRTPFIYISLLFIVSILIWVVVRPIRAISGWAFLPSGSEIDGISLIASSLWGIFFVLEQRHRVRHARKHPLTITIAPIVITGLLGIVAATVLLRYPIVAAQGGDPLRQLAAQIHPSLGLLYIIIIGAIALIALNQVFISGLDLISEMREEGLVHPLLEKVLAGNEVPVYSLLFLTSLMVATAVALDVFTTVGLAAIGLFLPSIFIFIPGLLQTKSPLPEERPLRLPLHPLFPAIVIVESIAFTITQPTDSMIIAGFWLGGGLLYYFIYARQATIAVRQSEVMISDANPVRSKTKPRLLICLSETTNKLSLITSGQILAQSQQVDLYILQVVTLPEQAANAQEKQVAQAAWQELTDLLGTIEATAVAITPLVRLAPSASEGILSTIWEEQIDSVLLGWPVEKTPQLLVQDGVIDHIVRQANCEVLILRGQLPVEPSQILVPMTSEAHSIAALTVGQALIGERQGDVVALKPIRDMLTEKREQQTRSQLQQTLQKLDTPNHIQLDIVHTTSPYNKIINQVDAYDVLLVGISDEGFLSQTSFGGLPVKLAENSNKPTILVKGRETQRSFVARQTWQRLTATIPAISVEQQANVFKGMRQNAKANIDFYMLIILSVGIAFFGLLQGSAAVIIGAMLVAPLMSPILAMAHSIVRGNIPMLRQAANSTINGVVMAISMAAFAAFVLTAVNFPLEPTSEILARTQPGILDLMVALLSGAAAAYAVSRAEVAAALPGVAIAAALVPPLAVVGYGLGTGRIDYAAGSLVLFLTNLAAIVLAGALMFLLLGIRPPLRDERGEQTRQGLRMAFLGFVVISIPLGLMTLSANNKATNDQIITTILTTWWLPNQATVENIAVVQKRQNIVVDFTVYDHAAGINTEDIALLQEELSTEIGGKPVILNAKVLPSTLYLVDDNTILPTWTPTATLTPTVTPTFEPTATAVPIIPPTITATQTLPPPPATLTPTPVITPTLPPITDVPTAVPTVNSTPTLTPTIPITPTATIPITPTISATVVPTSTPTLEPTMTPTAVVTNTATLIPTNTPPVQPTETPTIPPIDTPTSVMGVFYFDYLVGGTANISSAIMPVQILVTGPIIVALKPS